MPNKKEDTKTKQTKKDSKKKANKQESNSKKWFKDFRAELKKIIWPTKKQLWENVAVVVSMVVIVSLIIFLLDLGFKALNQLEVKGAESLKNKVSVSENVADEKEASENTTEESSENETEENTATEEENAVNIVSEESTNSAE